MTSHNIERLFVWDTFKSSLLLSAPTKEKEKKMKMKMKMHPKKKKNKMAADKLDKENSQASFVATAKKYPFCARIKKVF